MAPEQGLQAGDKKWQSDRREAHGEALAGRQLCGHVPSTPPDACLPGRWMDAGNLRSGDVVQLKSGRRATITRALVREVRQTVYNLQVEGLQTYAVGLSQVLVHNK